MIRKRAIATVCMPGTLSDKLSAAAEAGCQGVEIFENDLTYFDRAAGGRARAGWLARPRDRRPAAVSRLRGSAGAGAQQGLRAARHKFELMGRLGTPLLLVCSSISPEAINDMSRVAADLHELSEFARELGVRVGFEALAWGRLINDYRRPGRRCGTPTMSMSA